MGVSTLQAASADVSPPRILPPLNGFPWTLAFCVVPIPLSLKRVFGSFRHHFGPLDLALPRRAFFPFHDNCPSTAKITPLYSWAVDFPPFLDATTPPRTKFVTPSWAPTPSTVPDGRDLFASPKAPQFLLRTLVRGQTTPRPPRLPPFLCNMLCAISACESLGSYLHQTSLFFPFLRPFPFPVQGLRIHPPGSVPFPIPSRPPNWNKLSGTAKMQTSPLLLLGDDAASLPFPSPRSLAKFPFTMAKSDTARPFLL